MFSTCKIIGLLVFFKLLFQKKYINNFEPLFVVVVDPMQKSLLTFAILIFSISLVSPQQDIKINYEQDDLIITIIFTGTAAEEFEFGVGEAEEFALEEEALGLEELVFGQFAEDLACFNDHSCLRNLDFCDVYGCCFSKTCDEEGNCEYRAIC